MFHYQHLEAVLPPLEEEPVAPTGAHSANVNSLLRRDNAAAHQLKATAPIRKTSTAEEKMAQYEQSKREIFAGREPPVRNVVESTFKSPAQSFGQFAGTTPETMPQPRKVTVLRRRDLHQDEDYRR